MKSKFLLVLLASASLALTSVHGQISVSSFGQTQVDLSGWEGTSGSLPNGVEGRLIAGDDSELEYRGAVNTLLEASFTGGAGGVYAWGTGETLAFAATGSQATMAFDLTFQNNTGATLINPFITFDISQWRMRGGRASELSISAQYDSVTLDLGVIFSANVNSGTVVGRAPGDSAPDGFAADVVGYSFTLDGFEILDGDTFTVTFEYDRGPGSGSAQGIAVGNIAITAVPEPASYAAIFGGVALAGVALRRRHKSRI